MATKIAILGGGNGAFAAAADLTARGFEITIYENPEYKSNIEGILETGVIHCEGVGPVGDFKVQKVTLDLEEALSGTDIIMPIAPAYAQETVVRSLIPFIKPGDKIVLTPGSTGGALIFAKGLYEAGKIDGVRIAEMHTLPYATRKVDKRTVKILLEAKLLYFAAFPAKYNQEMYDLVKPIFPSIELMSDVLETSLNNGNASSHPAPVVLNAGKIEYYGKHYHYKEGITPSVAKVIQLIDNERMRICEAFGYKQVDIKERLYLMGYCPLKENLYDAYQGSTEIFLPIEGPNDLNGRYLTEDAPCSLVAMAELGNAAGIPTPLMDSVVNLASALKSEDYWQTGRTLEKMGLAGKNKEEIRSFLQNGY
jgi:opine dehydrogenase